MREKWSSFGFDVSEVNGHDIHQLEKNLKKFKKNEKQKPSITICHTIKGKGFHFAENNPFGITRILSVMRKLKN